MKKWKNANFSIFNAVVVLLVLLNIFTLKSTILGFILGLFWWFLSIFVLQKTLYQKISGSLGNALSMIFIVVFLILYNSALFYFFNLGQFVTVLGFVILSGVILFLSFTRRFEFDSKKLELSIRGGIYSFVFLVIMVVCFSILLTCNTNESITSPWSVVPKIFFLFYFLASASLIFSIFNKRLDERIKLMLIYMFSFLTFGVALFVYKIGFGFDPFVHRAAEEKLVELGYILPKPLYYVGQYSLITFLKHVFLWSTEWSDKLLVPVLAAIALPKIIYLSLKEKFENKNLLLLTTLSLLVLFTPVFFYTVPQGFSNLLLVTLAFLIFGKVINIWWQATMLLAIFLIHPLSGIAGLILICFNFDLIKRNKVVFSIVLILISFLVPLFFLAGSVMSGLNISFSTDNLSYVWDLVTDSFKYLRFNSIYHLVYLFKFNLVLIGIVLILIGLGKKLANYLILVVFIANLILLGFIKFGAVIDYEQGEFIKRFGQIVFLSLSPALSLGVYWLLSKIKVLKFSKLIILVLCSGIFVFLLYLAYPHTDVFVKARGYSVSKYDVNTVRWIDDNAGESEYVVLTNQSVAAASLQEFGFKKYFKNGLFYYPIPTSSPLYDIYLKMVYEEPSVDLIEKARELSGADTVYFVINDYWIDAKKIVAEASEIADEEMNIGNKVWIFKFEK